MWLKFLMVMIIAILSACMGCQPSGESLQQRQLAKAREALRQGDYEQVITTLDSMANTPDNSREPYLMRGLAYFKLREFHHAMDAFEKAQPSSTRLKYYMGYLYLFLGETAAAAALEKESRTARSQMPELDLLQGNIKLREQAFDGARATFHRVSSTVGHRAHAYMGLANTALLEKDLVAAEQYYLSALLASPDDIHTYLVLARFYMMMQRDDEAEANLYIALQKQPNHMNAILLLGNLLIKQDRCAEALSLYHQCKNLMSSSVLNLQALRCMLRENKHEQAAQIIASFQSKNSRNYLMLVGELNLRKGDIRTALSDFYGISRASKDFIVDYYFGVISLLRDDPDLALAYLSKSLQANASYTKAHLLTAVIYLSKHDYKEASKYATWAANLEPKYIEAHTIQGLTSYFQERYADASYAFDIVAELAPEHPIPHFFKALISMRTETSVAEGQRRELTANLHAAYIERMFLEMGVGQGNWHTDPGQIRAFMTTFTTYLKAHPSLIGAILAADYLQQVGELDRAESYIKEALALRKDCALCYYKLAYLANLRHQVGTATVYLEKALEINAQFIDGYRALGGLYEKQGEYARALRIYKRALNMAPNDASLLNNIGWLTLVELKDPGTAYVSLRKAASIMPNDPDVRDSLAWWHYHNRDTERAVQLLEPLVSDYPTHALYQYHLGMAHTANGQRAVGQQHLRLALQSGLKGEAAERAREDLR